jgi:hypothetical protein
MGRRKTNKEYTIRLVHPELGEFYYHYTNGDWGRNTYFFTRDLHKVTTWKTVKYVDGEIKKIILNLDAKSKSKILLEFGKDVPKEELLLKMTISRKKYYYPITKVSSRFHIDNAKNTLNKLEETLLNDSKFITKMIKKSRHVEDGFMHIVNKLTNDLNLYRKEYSFLENNKDSEPIYLDIVDASYGFRLLKLKTLKKAQTENEISS